VEAVRANGLIKRYGPTTAVDGLDLTLVPGEVRGLLGPNGAGKTTLLRMLFGLVTPDAGTIALLGRELTGLHAGALHGVGGFVEEPCFYGYLSGRANLALLARLDGRRRADGAIGEALARVDLSHRAQERVDAYSTGMRQRLGIAAALLRSPRLLLLDEPTSGLDPAGTRAVTKLVSELADDGVTVLLSSHQIGELETICTAYTLMRSGRVVWDGTAAECAAQAPVSAYALATSDDDAAQRIATEHQAAGVRVRRSPNRGLRVAGAPEHLDALVLALGDARVVIRRLELIVSPLESLFFALTDEAAPDGLDGQDLAERMLSAA